MSKNCSYCENKNATRVRKKTPWKWTNLKKMNVCQILNWNLNFRKVEETTHMQKYEKTHWHWLWKDFLYLCTGTAHKNRKHSVLLRWLKLCDSRKIHCLTSVFHVEFHLKKPISHSSLHDSCEIFALILETIFVNFYKVNIDTMLFLWFYKVIKSWTCNTNIIKLILKER